MSSSRSNKPANQRAIYLVCLVGVSALCWAPHIWKDLFAGTGKNLVLLAAWTILCFYCWQAPKIGIASAPFRRRLGISLVIGGLAVSLLGSFFLTFKLAWLGTIVATTGLMLTFLGVVPWTRVIAITSLIWVGWQWPGAIFERIDSKIHQFGIRSAVAAFDLSEVPVFSNGNLIEFRPRTLDTSVWMGGPDSSIGLLFVTVLGLVWFRRSLASSLLCIAFVPLIAWVGETAKVLLCFWGMNSFAADWSEGWALMSLRLSVAAVQVASIFLVNFGVQRALLPVMADVNARSNLTMHSLYNVITLWPLQISLTAQKADQDYLEDDDDDDDDDRPKRRSKYLAKRKMPDIEAAKRATNPWDNRKLWWTSLGLGVSAILFSIVGLFVPAQANLALPNMPLDSVQKVATNETFDGIEVQAQFTNASVDKLEDQYFVTWNFVGASGPVTLQTRFPSRSTSPMWIAPQGMQSDGVTRSYVVENVTIFENAFQGQMGAMSMGWFAAMTPEGTSIEEPGVWFRLQARLANSIAGRLLGLTNDQLMYETAMIVESPSNFSERQKRENRILFSKLTKRIAESVRSIQP